MWGEVPGCLRAPLIQRRAALALPPVNNSPSFIFHALAAAADTRVHKQGMKRAF